MLQRKEAILLMARFCTGELVRKQYSVLEKTAQLVYDEAWVRFGKKEQKRKKTKRKKKRERDPKDDLGLEESGRKRAWCVD